MQPSHLIVASPPDPWMCSWSLPSSCGDAICRLSSGPATTKTRCSSPPLISPVVQRSSSPLCYPTTTPAPSGPHFIATMTILLSLVASWKRAHITWTDVSYEVGWSGRSSSFRCPTRCSGLSSHHCTHCFCLIRIDVSSPCSTLDTWAHGSCPTVTP